MAVNFDNLNASIGALTTQLNNTLGAEASATVLLNGFAAAVSSAVQEAIRADDSVNQAAADNIQQAIDAVTVQFTNSATALGNAVAAVPPNAGTNIPVQGTGPATGPGTGPETAAAFASRDVTPGAPKNLVHNPNVGTKGQRP